MFKSKWRFTSLPDLMTILRAASVQAITLLVLDYVLLAPNVYGTFFFGKITIVLYWFLQMFFLAGTRIAYRYFRYTRTLSHTKADGALPTLVLGNAADAEVLLRAMESGAVTRRFGRSASCRRHAPIADKRSAASRCWAILTISRASSPISPSAGPTITRIVLTPTVLAPEARPEGVLMRARRLGPCDQSGCRRSIRAAKRCDWRQSMSKTCCCGRA